MLWSVLAAVAGYGAGVLLALFLDRCYTDAPWRGRPSVCADGHTPALAWAGPLGYLLLRGRCPAGGKLAARLWYLPLLGAGAGALIALDAGSPLEAALDTGFALVLLAFVGTDYERHLLPNRLMYPTLAAAAALSWVWPGRAGADALLGGALGFAILFVLAVVFPGFGFGDVKLAGLLGLLAGASNTIPALLIGMVAGGVASAVLLAGRRISRRTAIAYGPYLILGAFLGMLSAN